MKLCITEKPSVAADIAKIVGAPVRKNGYFEGPEYCVTWTFGHLCTLKAPDDYTPVWKSWALSTLPMIPPRFGIKLINDSGIKNQFHVIETLIKQCDEVINCGDAGQEGEVIQRWVMQKAGCHKPVKRLWISSLTDQAIRDGFAHLRPAAELDNLYTAGLCRAIGDWILGINGTRLYTLKYASGSRYDKNRSVLSVGRVQTPTLALVVSRQLEIDNFVPKTYWELKTVYRGATFSAVNKGYEDEAKGQKDLASIQGQPFVIDDVSAKKGKEAPPRLFDLTSLQVECNKRFGLSADQTLKTIQSLYEKKVATYPRVDTTYLTDDIYPKCGNILNSLTQMSDLLQPLRGAKLRKSKKVFDNSKVTDHHAIIPTGEKLPLLTPVEQQVFDTIALRFISVFYPDCEYEQTVVKGHSVKIPFKTTGRVILNPGWKAVYARQKEDSADEKSQEATAPLPAFTPGETGPHSPKLVTKTTQPPKLYTEGTLLKAMETAGSQVDDPELRDALKANGIGRPSTRANIIETLFKRGYMRKERKSIRATEAGIHLISLIKDDLLKSAKLTGIWEGKLREIERGEYSAAEFIDLQKQMINRITLTVLQDNSNTRIQTEAPPQKAAPKAKKAPAKKKNSSDAQK